MSPFPSRPRTRPTSALQSFVVHFGTFHIICHSWEISWVFSEACGQSAAMHPSCTSTRKSLTTRWMRKLATSSNSGTPGTPTSQALSPLANTILRSIDLLFRIHSFHIPRMSTRGSPAASATQQPKPPLTGNDLDARRNKTMDSCLWKSYD